MRRWAAPDTGPKDTVLVMPMVPEQVEKHTHDSIRRHGTTDLSAALNVLSGSVR